MGSLQKDFKILSTVLPNHDDRRLLLLDLCFHTHQLRRSFGCRNQIACVYSADYVSPLIAGAVSAPLHHAMYGMFDRLNGEAQSSGSQSSDSHGDEGDESE